MKPGRRWAPGRLVVLAFCCGLCAGCGVSRSHLDRRLLAWRPPAGGPQHLAELYTVRFPDVLEITVNDRPDLSGSRPLRIDGRIEFASDELLRVEGRTTPQISLALADHAGIDPDLVHVRVKTYNSQRLFLHGEVKGDTRAVPYVGPETVLEMLQRVGGITAGAAPGDIQVIRAQVAEGKSPEVFEVNLTSILLKNDQETNVRLRPLDQVHVGQRRSSSVQKCLPPWIRPLFSRVSGLARPGDLLLPALAERRQPRYRASSAP